MRRLVKAIKIILALVILLVVFLVGSTTARGVFGYNGNWKNWKHVYLHGWMYKCRTMAALCNAEMACGATGDDLGFVLQYGEGCRMQRASEQFGSFPEVKVIDVKKIKNSTLLRVLFIDQTLYEKPGDIRWVMERSVTGIRGWQLRVWPRDLDDAPEAERPYGWHPDLWPPKSWYKAHGVGVPRNWKDTSDLNQKYRKQIKTF